MTTRNRFRIRWLIYLALVAAVFGAIETLALGNADGLTLSRLVYDAWHAWPPLGPLMGIGVGILISHFFWEWSPKLQDAEQRIKELEAQVAAIQAGPRE